MNHKKRVLFMESYPHVIFGQQRTMLTLLQTCDAAPIEPVVGVTGNGPFVHAAKKLGKKILFFDYPSLLANYGGAIYRYHGLRKFFFGWQVFKYIRRLRSLLKKNRIEGVFCNDMRGLLTVGIAARSLNIPIMIWDKLDRPHGWLDWIELPLARRIAFISEAVKDKFPAWQLRFYKKRLRTVPNGADIPRFDAALPSERRSLGGDDKNCIFAIIGSITPRKGQDRLLTTVPRLMKALPDARILIIGEEAGSPADQYYCDNLPNRDHSCVSFLGFRDDIPAIMKNIDVLVIPSRHEGMGQVVAEAMACRKPVIGARTGGIQEVIADGETGFLFDGDNSEQLLSALIRLGRSPELRRKMGEAGRRRVEKYYDRSVQMSKITDIMTEMVQAQGRKW